MDKRTYPGGLTRPDRDTAMALMNTLKTRTDLHADKDFMALLTISFALLNEVITLDDRITALEGAVETSNRNSGDK